MRTATRSEPEGDSNLQSRRAPSTIATTAEPQASAASEVITALQETHGNQWVQRLVGRVAGSQSAGREGGPLEDDLVQRIQAERSHGQPLQPKLQQDAERALGADLSAVRVHTDVAASALNEQLGARAFTTGRDIFFGADTEPADRSVLLHESTHAIQQGMSETAPQAIGAADTSDEHIAESAASATAARLKDEADGRGGGVQRDDDPKASNDGNQCVNLPSCDVAFDLPCPAPQEFTPQQIAALVPGYAPPAEQNELPQTSDPNTALALRLSADEVVQREDSSPHPSVDLQLQYPWAAQVTLVDRDWNAHRFTNQLGKLDILHEPQAAVTLSADPDAWLAGSLSIGILNQHLHLLSQETEVQLMAQLNEVIQPQAKFSLGPDFQLEQHVWKGISATINVGGFWVPPQGGKPGRLDFQTNAGLTVHFDGF
jgi:Domain of unknown function (DUF4157)